MSAEPPVRLVSPYSLAHNVASEGWAHRAELTFTVAAVDGVAAQSDRALTRCLRRLARNAQDQRAYSALERALADQIDHLVGVEVPDWIADPARAGRLGQDCTLAFYGARDAELLRRAGARIA